MVLERIKNLLPDIQPVYRKIALYVLENFESIGFISVHTLSDIIGVSNASIVRFAQSLGFKGYKEFREMIQEDIKYKLDPNPNVALDKLDLKPALEQVQELFQNEILNLKKTLNDINVETFVKMVKEVKLAKRLFVSGFGVSRNIMQILEFALVSMQSKEIINITGSISDYNPRLHTFRKGDCLFLMTLPPYSLEGLQVADFVSKRGGKLFLFTDSLKCPIYPLADAFIRCENNSLLLTNSYVGMIAVIQIFINMLLLDNKAVFISHIKEVHEGERQGYKYIGMQKEGQ